MGVSKLMNELFSPDTIKLSKIVRPYLVRSAYLVKACRQIQTHWGMSTVSTQDPVRLRSIFLLVRDALERSTSPLVRDSNDPKTEELFEQANKAIQRYLDENHMPPEVRSKAAQDFENATNKDIQATRHLQDFKKRVKQRLDIVRRFKNIDFSITIWPEKVRSKDRWASHKVPFTIEECATLDILLVRVLCALPDLEKKNISPFSLIQNPQFFNKFPHTSEAFEKAMKTTSPVDNLTDYAEAVGPLAIYQRMEDCEKLDINLIVDRRQGLDMNDPEVSAFRGNSKRIVKEYKNIWKLEHEDRYIVRQFTGALVMADPGRQPRSLSTNFSNTSRDTRDTRRNHQTKQSLTSTSQETVSTGYSSAESYWPSPSVHSSRTTLTPVSEPTGVYSMPKPRTQRGADSSFVPGSPQELPMPERGTQSTRNAYFIPQTSTAVKAHLPTAKSQLPTPPATTSVTPINPSTSDSSLPKPPRNHRVASTGQSSGLKHHTSHTQTFEDSSALPPASPPQIPDTFQPNSRSPVSARDAGQTTVPPQFAMSRSRAAPRFMPPESESQTSPPIPLTSQPTSKALDPIPVQQKSQSSDEASNASFPTNRNKPSAKTPDSTPAPSQSSAPTSSSNTKPTVARAPSKVVETKVTPSPSAPAATPVPKPSKPQGTGFNNVGSANGRRTLGTVDIVLPEKSGFFGGLKKKLWG